MPPSLLASLHRRPTRVRPSDLRRRAVGRGARLAGIAALLLLLLSLPLMAGNGMASGLLAAQNQDGTVPGDLRLTATFKSIGVELPFTGDANGTATARLEFRKAGDEAWREGLALWRTADPSGAAFYGSALLLDAGTAYDVRVTVDDGDGVSGTAQQASTVTTRTDAIPAAESLVPTFFVRAEGDDALDGGSPASAWRTIDKAVRDAPAEAVVQVGAGYYAVGRGTAQAPLPARTRPLTLVAEHPAVKSNREPINAGQRSVIESVGVSSPSGATDGPNPGVWRQVTLAGPRTGAPYTVWQWAGSPLVDATQLGYAAGRAESPIRVAHWARDKADLSTPSGWAEKLYTNLTYNYGFFSAGSDLYVRLPGDQDPNRLYITASDPSQSGLSINGPDVRLSGFEVRQLTNGVNVLWKAERAVIDGCLLTGNSYGVAFKADRPSSGAAGSKPATYGSDHLVQGNLIRDSSLRADGSSVPADGGLIPWMFIKTKVREADGSEYPTTRIGGQSETTGVSGRGGALRAVVRQNTIDGPFNGVGSGYNEGFDRYSGQDMDVYDNLIRHIADDALEPEFAAINFRAWDNRVEDSLTVLSTGPVHYGPVFLFRNVATEIGNDGDAPDGQGRLPGSTMLKYSGSSNPAARVFVLHNTFWTDRAADGGGQFASSGASSEAFYLRNNLIRATQYAFAAPKTPGAWDEDSNLLVTVDQTRGLSYNGTVYRGNVQAYRDASGQGARTNPGTDFAGDVSLIDPTIGDVRLPADSPLVDAGVPVPNVSDRSGIDYQGAAPDIGYERR